MENLGESLNSLAENHRRALQWFIDHADTEQSWPSALEGNLLLVTKAKGIFKPNWSDYALSVRQVLNSPYPDRDPIMRSDGTWVYQYYQEGDKPHLRDQAYTNRSLMACWRDKIPVGVMRQKQGKPHVRYNILGLALVAGWEEGYFFFEGFSPAGISRGKGPQAEIDIILSVGTEAEIFDPKDVLDARMRTLASIVRRQGQKEFRQALLDAYIGKCAISKCTVTDALEAAHIVPYLGPKTNHISNGLLLRADLHILFDIGKIAIDTKSMTVVIAPELKQTDYLQFDKVKIYLPNDKHKQPSIEALDQHRSWAGL